MTSESKLYNFHHHKVFQKCNTFQTNLNYNNSLDQKKINTDFNSPQNKYNSNNSNNNINVTTELINPPKYKSARNLKPQGNIKPLEGKVISGSRRNMTNESDIISTSLIEEDNVFQPESIIFLKYSQKIIYTMKDLLIILRNKIIKLNLILILIVIISFSNVYFYSARNLIFLDLASIICNLLSLYAIITIKPHFIIINLILTFPLLIFCYIILFLDLIWYETNKKSNFNLSNDLFFAITWLPFLFFGYLEYLIYKFMNGLYVKSNFILKKKNYKLINNNDSILKKSIITL